MNRPIQLTKQARRRRRRLRRFADRFYPREDFYGPENMYLRSAAAYRRIYIGVIILGVVVATLLFLHIGKVI